MAVGDTELGIIEGDLVVDGDRVVEGDTELGRVEGDREVGL